jgi:simple sugar transport system permease protein
MVEQYSHPKNRISQLLKYFQLKIWPLVSAVLLTIFFVSVALILIGKDPLRAFEAIATGAFGSRNALAEVLVKTSPLLLAGLGTAFAFRCQIWNIGAEGQLLMGALGASIFSLLFPGTPPVLSIILALLAAIVAGGLWGGLAGLLKVKLGASEIINTIMMNYIAIYLINYLVRGSLKDTASYVPQSAVFSSQFWLPVILPPTRLHLGIMIAVLAAVIVYIILWKTPFGFNIITVGSNIRAAKVGGINVSLNLVIAMFISGALSGIAGASEVLGLHHRLLDGVSAGYGFSAMTVAILGGLHPVGITIFSFVFAALRVGADHMQRAIGVPSSLVYLVEGLLIVFVQGRYILPRLLASIRKKYDKPKDG